MTVYIFCAFDAVKLIFRLIITVLDDIDRNRGVVLKNVRIVPIPACGFLAGVIDISSAEPAAIKLCLSVAAVTFKSFDELQILAAVHNSMIRIDIIEHAADVSCLIRHVSHSLSQRAH